MKRLCLILALGGALAAQNAFASFDGSVQVNGSVFANGSGGEFQAISTGLGTFQTFCLEDVEYFQPGGTYNYQMNSGAVAGGGGAGAIDPNTGLSMDNVSIGTAWLYSQFRAGTLANYFGASRQANAGVLQGAIWMLEGEVAYNAANVYLAIARTALGMNDVQLQADANGAYGVVALNLYNGPAATQVTAPDGKVYYLNQDMLGIVPEPTTMIAGALLLLPFGASTLQILRKRRTA